ncbi:ATP-binding protein [Persicirhabdus sediminis]|uniref:histidine kinase n=1 Tax=Persicirhabdus sediminis TaxID=454144 RepID=A0A8J7MEB8_9BACT|nr:ATP-binding protein [Persicirhabdus sediminis]MBK1791822.1 PAS domain-containing protein [Persicirhabdus sediminis]
MVLSRDQLIDDLDDAILIITKDGLIEFANKQASRLCGDRQLNGRTLIEAFIDDRLAQSILDCVAKGGEQSDSIVLPGFSSPLNRDLGRSDSAWSLCVSPYKDSSGVEHGWYRVIMRDATESYNTDQVRRDFVANASHELRTPLAIISGYLENLLDDDLVEDTELARRFMGKMRKHSDRMARLVDEMLMLSRMESGIAQNISAEEFYLIECIDDVRERLSSIIVEQKAKLKVEVADDLLIIADRFYLTQVLFNLIENALKQNRNEKVRVVVSAGYDNGSVAIKVTDNGIGIPANDIPFIFRRFYRVEKHHNRDQVAGTGLGLSIVKRAVEAHGGEISVNSQPGLETCFTMRLPWVQKSAEKSD